jgi:DNA-binding NarL/FixJ family response regulator
MALRVVLVDDDRRFRTMARRALVAEGVDVVAEIGDGADAVAVVDATRPEVVLVDIRMPGVNGLEVARRLQERPGGPVVILISTVDDAEGQRLATDVAAGYVPKDELSLAAIHEILGAAPR